MTVSSREQKKTEISKALSEEIDIFFNSKLSFLKIKNNTGKFLVTIDVHSQKFGIT